MKTVIPYVKLHMRHCLNLIFAVMADAYMYIRFILQKLFQYDIITRIQNRWTIRYKLKRLCYKYSMSI